MSMIKPVHDVVGVCLPLVWANRGRITCRNMRNAGARKMRVLTAQSLWVVACRRILRWDLGLMNGNFGYC